MLAAKFPNRNSDIQSIHVPPVIAQATCEECGFLFLWHAYLLSLLLVCPGDPLLALPSSFELGLVYKLPWVYTTSRKTLSYFISCVLRPTPEYTCKQFLEHFALGTVFEWRPVSAVPYPIIPTTTKKPTRPRKKTNTTTTEATTTDATEATTTDATENTTANTGM